MTRFPKRRVPALRRVREALGGTGDHGENATMIGVRRDFYGPVPDLASVPAEAWVRRSAMAGVHFDTDSQIRWAERELSESIARFRPPPGFELENRYYEIGDAEICDAILRWSQAERVVELGSGWSTLLLRNAVGSERVRTYDPYPARFVDGVDPTPAQEIALEVFTSLDAGDVLFVDTSHTVKLGSDVNHVILEVLPRLSSGVLVHFHDIWLPYEYHRHLLEAMGMFWNEQYLLHAFLIGNPDWEVLFATQAVAREHPQRFRRLVPSYTGVNYPTSFWLRRASTA